MKATGALVALTAAVLVTAASGGAAWGSDQVVQQYSFHGTVAEAIWDTSSSTTSTSTDLTVSRNQQGRGLSVYQFTTMFDPGGTYIGASFTIVDVTSGFFLSINPSLSSASTSGSNLPATTCFYDASDHLTGCTPTTIDVSASWTGEGPITSGTSTTHFHSDGFTSTYHQHGAFREATATGTVGGLTLNAGDLVEALLGNATNGSVEICIGDAC